MRVWDRIRGRRSERPDNRTELVLAAWKAALDQNQEAFARASEAMADLLVDAERRSK